MNDCARTILNFTAAIQATATAALTTRVWTYNRRRSDPMRAALIRCVRRKHQRQWRIGQGGIPKIRDLKKQGCDCECKSHYEDLATGELEGVIFSLETAGKRDKTFIVMGKLSAGLRPQQAANPDKVLPAKYSALMCVGRRLVRCMVWAITLCAHSKNTQRLV